MIRFHVSLSFTRISRAFFLSSTIVFESFPAFSSHTACWCCCLNFRTAPLSLKRTWLDCLSRNSIYFVWLCGWRYWRYGEKKFETWLRDQFRNFRQLVGIYLQARFFSVWPLELSKYTKKNNPPHCSLYLWNLMFIAINPLNNLKF